MQHDLRAAVPASTYDIWLAPLTVVALESARLVVAVPERGGVGSAGQAPVLHTRTVPSRYTVPVAAGDRVGPVPVEAGPRNLSRVACVGTVPDGRVSFFGTGVGDRAQPPDQLDPDRLQGSGVQRDRALLPGVLAPVP